MYHVLAFIPNMQWWYKPPCSGTDLQKLGLCC